MLCANSSFRDSAVNRFFCAQFPHRMSTGLSTERGCSVPLMNGASCPVRLTYPQVLKWGPRWITGWVCGWKAICFPGEVARGVDGDLPGTMPRPMSCGASPLGGCLVPWLLDRGERDPSSSSILTLLSHAVGWRWIGWLRFLVPGQASMSQIAHGVKAASQQSA